MKRPRKWRVNLLSGRAMALGLLSVFFLVGSFAGCMAGGVLDVGASGTLLDWLEDALSALEHRSGSVRFLPILWQTARAPLMAFVLGLTALGVVGLPLLFAGRGFCLCYAVTVVYRLLGSYGLLLGGCLFGVSALLWLPALMELGVTSFTGACGLLRRVTGDGRYPLTIGGRRFWLRCGVCAGAVTLCACVEYLLIPVLVRMVAHTLQ